MTKSSAIKSLAVFSLAALTTLSVAANAESYSTYKQQVPGVVQKVDSAASTITIKTEDGVTKTFNVLKDAKVATEKGRAMTLGSLQKGDTVILKNRTSTPVAGKTLSAN